MSDPFDAPDSPPPPSYEFCQQEFDQKIAHALEASSSHPAPAADEDWEEWDEAAFAAAAARLTITGPAEGSLSSSSRSTMDVPASKPALESPTSSGKGKSNSEARSTIQPLRIVKKSPASPAREKERPSWYSEAGLDASNPIPAPQPVSAAAAPSGSSSQHAVNTDRVAPSYAEPRNSAPMYSSYVEREQTPPPMFTAVAESLDGPPYEEPPHDPGLVLAYIPGDSRPASPLHSPTSPALRATIPDLSPISPISESRRRSLPRPPSHSPHGSSGFTASISPPISPPPVVRPHHQSLPPPPPQVTVPRSSPRPTSTYNLKTKTTSYSSPRLTFDHRVAYGGSEKSRFDASREERLSTTFDAASLYSSSVASIYSSAPPAARVPAPRPASSFYSQPAHAQAMPQANAAQGMERYMPGRIASPVPSVHSTHSGTQNFSQTWSTQSGSQQTQLPNASAYQPANAQQAFNQSPAYNPYQQNSYQPTAYQQPAYQQQPYQQSNYQQPTHQQNSYQTSTVQPTGYQSNGYRPTSF